MSRAIQDLKRAREVVNVLGRYGFMIDPAFLARIPGLKLLSPEPGIAALGRGERAKRVLEELGPTYVKLGQVLSIRPDLLPGDVIESLSELQKDVAPLPHDELEALVEGYLGAPIADHFEFFDLEPLAAASIAQVHRARLRVDGEVHDVVVKLQRPGIREKMESDLSILYWLARALEASIEEASLYRPVAIVREFEAALLQELDFLHEARNLKEVASNFASRPGLLRVPTVYELLSSQKLLVMGFVDGIRITDIVGDDAHDPEQVLDRALEIIFDMIFEDGFFHGDPHPGNMLVTPDGTIGMLDFGLMGRLTRDQQDTLIQLALAAFTRNASQLTRVVMKMGEVPSGFDRDAFEAGVVDLMDRYLGLELQDIATENLIRECLELITEHRIRLPANYAVLARAAGTIEGIGRIIYPKFDIIKIGAPYVARLVKQRLEPARMAPELMGMGLTLQQFLTDAPELASRLMDDVTSGRLQFDVKGSVFEELVAMQRVHSLRMVVIAAIATMVLTAAITLAPFQYTLTSLGAGEEWPVPVVPVLALLGALGLCVPLILSYLFPRGPRKLAIRRTLLWRLRKR